jgi:CHASE3 domain sensor protein
MLCTLLGILTTGLAGALVGVTMEMHDSLTWVDHSSQVLRSANRVVSTLREAESGQRGFILTQNPEC